MIHLRIKLLLAFSALFLQVVVAQHEGLKEETFRDEGYAIQHGAITRGDVNEKRLAMVFTGDLYADGMDQISQVLDSRRICATFFLTGNFYRNPGFAPHIRKLLAAGHSLGAHSNRHLLYCDWQNRDSLLVSREEFVRDLRENYLEMQDFGIQWADAPFFLPPFEWYNDTISAWTRSLGLQLVNYTPGTLSHADYTVPGTAAYRSSQEIYQSILEYERDSPEGLNGFILLMHAGSVADRKDKFYHHLEPLLEELTSLGYAFVPLTQLLEK